MESVSVENLSAETVAISHSVSTTDLTPSSSPEAPKKEVTASETSLNFITNNGDLFGNVKPADDANTSAINSSTSSINNTSGGSNNTPLNEKVAHLASSIYTELEKIVKLHGRDTVKDLMSIVVNVLEGLDTAYQDKEELIVENELLKDDYEKLLSQYEREKQARKDTELVRTD